MPFRYRLLLLVSLVVLTLDQATKYYIDSHFALYESVTVLPNFFHISYVRNQGAAFGLLANRAPGLRPGPGGGRGVSLGRFLSEVWKTVVDFATEPLAILAAVLFVIMWVLWTLRSRAV